MKERTMPEIREGYVAMHINFVMNTPPAIRAELGMTGVCSLCYRKRTCTNDCLVGLHSVIVPEHIATIIKINATKGENHD